MISNYDKTPYVEVRGPKSNVICGWSDICTSIKGKNHKSIVIETYQGVFEDRLAKELTQSMPGYTIFTTYDAFKNQSEISKLVYPDVTDDEIFGRITKLTLLDFFDATKLRTLSEAVSKTDKSIVIGPGASLVNRSSDCFIYADLARWEIQQRMRKDLVPNLGLKNHELKTSLQYKQSYFVDWRVLDRHKFNCYDDWDFYLDTHNMKNPKLIQASVLFEGIKSASEQPFRVVPFFDPGPWGGQWMKEVCDLNKDEDNFAWCFDCVPEENSLLIKVNDEIIETPSINLIFKHPKELLGEHVYKNFGAEFPIRFDFLDTMDGGNLSLQVHPLKEYIQQQNAMPYTQDESYYMLDAKEGAEVYLGLKEGVHPEIMINELNEAQENGSEFDARKHIETWKVKKHDHVLIPAGTIHCSGANSMVLEISSTPYIFTYKLYDWGRMGLDGKPRPINIEHGKNVIQWNRTTQWTKENLVNRIEPIAEGEGWREERTGLHDLEFIETRRHWFSQPVHHNTNGTVNVLNLVEGREAIVESPKNKFSPFKVHYAETFIIPASVGEYTIRPCGESEGKEIATIKAYVRPSLEMNS